jgi:FkbM family methyltransferase
VRHHVFNALDRRGCRWLLVLLGSAFVTIARRSLCRVELRDGIWLHHYRGVVIPWVVPGGDSPKELQDSVEDRFAYDYLPSAGDVVVDVGAGFGEEAWPFSQLVGNGGRVLCFEAHPRAYRGLRALVEHNHLANVETFNVALVAEAQHMRISDDDPLTKGNTVIGQIDGIDVEGKTFDSMASELGLSYIDLVKINIEGAEVLALQGMVESLKKTRHLFIECHDFMADRGFGEAMRTKGSVRAFLESHGFAVRGRDDAERDWINDSLYATNTRL